MLTAVRAETAARLSEVFQLIELIRQLESSPPQPDPAEAKILRGLFWVHLYAALEYAVNSSTQRFLQAVEALNVPPEHLKPCFFSVALEPNFSALRNVGEDKRWTKRMEFLGAQSSAVPNKINADIFGLYLQNIWAEKIEALFACFGITQAIVPDPSYKPYIDELVMHRNGIAHGRTSALGVGSARRSPDLLLRYEAISATCKYIFDCLEQHHTSRGVIQPVRRVGYP
ncbi:MAE_28990/MAE_18760 family HEPN-like nuclease [Pseudomonas brassicacearum]|uniref:MAE_28990/MAE_18760 family HEPN-like nuclease n=1 Tax=Pseudomonas brassicacearum TaxID=930166 RepID=UPI0011CE4AF7|nr:MAE_28990/MAE_18760 family HEPN-like nuclease [Pseudomonas brassicacearum]